MDERSGFQRLHEEDCEFHKNYAVILLPNYKKVTFTVAPLTALSLHSLQVTLEIHINTFSSTLFPHVSAIPRHMLVNKSYFPQMKHN